MRDQHQDGLEQIDGLEAGDDDGNAEILVVAITGNGADVAGGDEPLHASIGGAEEEAHGRRDEHLGDEHGKIA